MFKPNYIVLFGTLFHKYNVLVQLHKYKITVILKRRIVWSGRLSSVIALEEFGEVSAAIDELTFLV